MTRFSQGNLAFLSYGANSTILDGPGVHFSGIEVDLRTSTWSCGGETYAIGAMRQRRSARRFGVIGIYDRTYLDHLRAMLHTAKVEDKKYLPPKRRSPKR